jgi:hypothetical protein
VIPAKKGFEIKCLKMQIIEFANVTQIAIMPHMRNVYVGVADYFMVKMALKIGLGWGKW